MQGEQGEPRAGVDRWEQAILAQPGIVRHDTEGQWFHYRAGRVIVDAELAEHKGPSGDEARATLRSLKARRVLGAETADRIASELGLQLWHSDDAPEVLPGAVHHLRTLSPHAASLDHVLIGDPHRFGGTGPADPAPRPGDIPGAEAKFGASLTVAILDTGIDPELGLAISTPSDVEVLDEDGDLDLDPPAGHGTFVAGVVRRWAPGAEIHAHRLLRTPAGIASDLDVAEALLALPEVDVINCSFGGPSQHDAPPLVIERALARLSPKTVVVASAGNQGEARPHWPGACKRVIAVAAVEPRCDESWACADYSNFGWWVDACALGTDIESTFVAFKESGPDTNRIFKHGAKWSGTSFAAPAVTGAILALASRDGIPVKEAVYRLIDDPSRLRITDAGTLVLPDQLP